MLYDGHNCHDMSLYFILIVAPSRPFFSPTFKGRLPFCPFLFLPLFVPTLFSPHASLDSGSMGHFKSTDGRQYGSLGAILCCGATVDDDELQPGTALAPSGICNEQPSPRPSMPPMKSVRTGESRRINVPSLDTRRHVATLSGQPAFHGSEDSHEPSWLSTSPTAPSPRVRSMNALSPAPLYTRPYRAFNQTGVRRQSLVPLRLGPVVLRDLPSIDTNDPTHSDWTLDLANSRSDFWGSLADVKACPTSEVSAVNPANPPSPTRSSTIPLPRGTSKTSTPSLMSQRSNARSRKLQKCSATELRRIESNRLDQEILELDAIVREHKAEAARTRASNQHVAAVAPSMHIMARSETLDDIGSALSRPLTAQSRSDFVSPDRRRPEGRSQTSYSMQTDSWSSSAAADWLYNLLRSSSPTRTASDNSCYALDATEAQRQQRRERGRSHSDGLMSESFLISDSSSGSSAAYSIHDSCHSRSVTEESGSSRLSSPITPPSSRREFDGTRGCGKEDLLPSGASIVDEVGVAL